MKKQKTVFNNLLSKRFFGVLAIFVASGFALYALASAAVAHGKFEAEAGSSLNCATVVESDANAAEGKSLKYGCSTPPSTGKVFNHPGVVYSKTQIDSWSTSSAQYTKLAAAGPANPTSTSSTYVPYNFGTKLETTEQETYKDQSGFAKVQAVLWAADNNQARKDRATAYLDKYKTITSYDADSARHDRLFSGWVCTNLAQTAEIINYQDSQFKSFLKNVCYPQLDWTGGGNWHASFADSRLAIAAYLGDETLWKDAKAYFHERIKQSFFHSKYDGNKAHPLHNEDNGTSLYIHTNAGTPHLGRTQFHWGGAWTTTEVKSDYTFDSARYGNPVDGMNVERLRDYGHIGMSMSAWMHGVKTIVAQGEQIEQQAYDRLLAGFDYQSKRVLHYVNTGTHLSPAPTRGDGGGAMFEGFEMAKKYFGSSLPASANSVMQLSQLKNRNAVGANHTLAEQYTDGQ